MGITSSTTASAKLSGNFVKEDSLQPRPRSKWLFPTLLPRCSGPDPELCPLFQALRELSNIAANASGLADNSSALPSTNLGGSAQVLLTEVPSLSSLLALRQFQLLLPTFQVSLALRGEPPEHKECDEI